MRSSPSCADTDAVVRSVPPVPPAMRSYTPPQLITLLITDLGVLTPAAVSDQLILLYQ